MCVYFDVPDDLAETFRFVQGQHLPVSATIDGEEVRRTYSICAAVADAELRIGVRVQPGGRFSEHVANNLKVGDQIDVMPPVGHFQTSLSADQNKTYLAFAAGSGITPILSIAKTTLQTEPGSRFLLFYGNRSHESAMFVDALYEIKNAHPERFTLQFVFSREEQEYDIANGRFDADKVRELHQGFCKNLLVDEVFVCGPGSMIETVTSTLSELGVDAQHIHSEHFVVADTEASEKKRPAQAVGAKASDDQVEVTVILDGHRKQFDMPPEGLTVLEAARESGLELPFSCEGGVCSTCRTHLSEGQVEMDVNYALEDWEVEEGFVLACQARPLTRKLVLDYDKS